MTPDANQLTPDDYQRLARRTRNPEIATTVQLLTHGQMGLAGETGEVCELIKKFLYHGRGLDRQALVDEMGDVCWYVAELADALGVPFETVLRRNLEKLQARHPDGQWLVVRDQTRCPPGAVDDR